VTGVKTSPDLSARVYVSVLGDDPERSASIDGLRSAHGFLQAAWPRAEAQHTPSLTFEYDDTVDRGMRISRLLDDTAPEEETSGPVTATALRDRVLSELREAENAGGGSRTEPRRRAIGPLVAMRAISPRSARTCVIFNRRARKSRLPTRSTPSSLWMGGLRASGDVAEANDRVPGLRNIERNPPGFRRRAGRVITS